jgi:hypothetical protein
MIIKIHSRGIGSGSGPVDYLLGKDRDRQDARLDRGDPEQMIQLLTAQLCPKIYIRRFILCRA